MMNPDEQLKKVYDTLQIRVDTDLLEAHIGELKWKVREDGHTKEIKHQIIELKDKFKREMRKLEEADAPEMQRAELAEDTHKQILELCLLGFDYDKLANDVRAGPKALEYLMMELDAFLVDQGGQVGLKHSQTVSKLIILNSSLTTKALRTSTTSSVSPSTPEPTSSESTN